MMKFNTFLSIDSDQNTREDSLFLSRVIFVNVYIFLLSYDSPTVRA